MFLVARSENNPAFRDGFCRLGGGQKAIWGRFLNLAPESQAEFWVAFDGESPIGRIGANLMHGYQEYGAIGFFEAKDATVASLLLKAAESWLKEKGVHYVVGPMQ